MGRGERVNRGSALGIAAVCRGPLWFELLGGGVVI